MDQGVRSGTSASHCHNSQHRAILIRHRLKFNRNLGGPGQISDNFKATISQSFLPKHRPLQQNVCAPPPQISSATRLLPSSTAPIVVVRKKNGDVRVWIDFATGLNDCLELNRHLLPRIDDIFAALEGSTVFSQIDFRDAYLQIALDEESKELVGINTYRGLFQYQRLPFGVKSAPSIFQKLWMNSPPDSTV
ncbi:hypothetical protein niasHT_034249 [Heterodera trifolii]|uniref:Reverse transcriptase domain-containing protein n=1 Tax=Heterodera trifolii TaxID=157864 RepID=A0ABD2IQL4_9BILA